MRSVLRRQHGLQGAPWDQRLWGAPPIHARGRRGTTPGRASGRAPASRGGMSPPAGSAQPGWRAGRSPPDCCRAPSSSGSVSRSGPSARRHHRVGVYRRSQHHLDATPGQLVPHRGFHRSAGLVGTFPDVHKMAEQALLANLTGATIRVLSDAAPDLAPVSPPSVGLATCDDSGHVWWARLSLRRALSIWWAARCLAPLLGGPTWRRLAAWSPVGRSSHDRVWSQGTAPCPDRSAS